MDFSNIVGSLGGELGTIENAVEGHLTAAGVPPTVVAELSTAAKNMAAEHGANQEAITAKLTAMAEEKGVPPMVVQSLLQMLTKTNG